MKIEDVARQVVAALNSDAGFLLSAKWVADRYRQLCSRTRFRHLRQVGQVQIVAATHTGTVSVTHGSNLVTTTDADAIAAWTLIEKEIPRRWFRAQTNWHEIVDVSIGASSASLKLSVPYVENTNSGASYYIIDRFVRLDPQVRWLGDTMLLQNRSVAIENMSFAELDITYPRRPIVSGYGPIWWSDYGDDKLTKAKIIEFYPYSTQDHLVHYVYWTQPPDLKEHDEVPREVDTYILREGALIDAMRYEAAKAIRAGGGEAAAFWTNNYRAQETKWERYILEAVRNDRGIDDIGFIMRSNRESRPRDVVSARDEIFARGNRP